MKFTRDSGAMEQTIKKLNTFIDQCTIRCGTHRGYIRVFNCGDHQASEWNLGGRFYSQGALSTLYLLVTVRLKMTIDGEPVCELDIKASYSPSSKPALLKSKHGPQQGLALIHQRCPDRRLCLILPQPREKRIGSEPLCP
jgi:hypothetical protein